MPPLNEYIKSLKVIWESKDLTNGGPFTQQFESALAKHLKVPYMSLFNNATMAHSVIWNHLEPVFVDIEPDTCCFIDSSFMERSEVYHRKGIPVFDTNMIELLINE